MGPPPRMYPPQVWLFPEDANDFPKELRDPSALVVVVLPDGGRSYLSKIYNDAWMEQYGFIDRAALRAAKLPQKLLKVIKAFHARADNHNVRVLGQVFWLPDRSTGRAFPRVNVR